MAVNTGVKSWLNVGGGFVSELYLQQALHCSPVYGFHCVLPFD